MTAKGRELLLPLLGRPATFRAAGRRHGEQGSGTSPGTPRQSDRLVIFASSLGTVFEWYDFYLYGLLATIISAQFFSGVNETTGFIFALAAFAAGFAVRPFGAILFGRIGDLVGRKNTFLVTMGADGPFDLRGRASAELCQRRSRRSDPSGRAPAGPGPGAGRRIWRGGDLCRRACAAGAARLLHQLHPDHRDARPVRGFARRDRNPDLDGRGGIRRMGLAAALPGLDPASRACRSGSG